MSKNLIEVLEKHFPTEISKLISGLHNHFELICYNCGHKHYFNKNYRFMIVHVQCICAKWFIWSNDTGLRE